jgi:hypothetical protein
MQWFVRLQKADEDRWESDRDLLVGQGRTLLLLVVLQAASEVFWGLHERRLGEGQKGLHTTNMCIS